jgi:hypothetical protein
VAAINFSQRVFNNSINLNSTNNVKRDSSCIPVVTCNMLW